MRSKEYCDNAFNRWFIIQIVINHCWEGKKVFQFNQKKCLINFSEKWRRSVSCVKCEPEKCKRYQMQSWRMAHAARILRIVDVIINFQVFGQLTWKLWETRTSFVPQKKTHHEKVAGSSKVSPHAKRTDLTAAEQRMGFLRDFSQSCYVLRACQVG